MKDSIEGIKDKGNSTVLLQLAEKIRNSNPTTDEVVEEQGIPLVYEDSFMNDSTVNTNVLVVKESEDMYYADSTTQKIQMNAGMSNQEEIEPWELGVCTSLIELFIGSACLAYLKELKLVGLENLEKVMIGSRSFTMAEGRLEVSNCPKLKKLKIDTESCLLWKSFELKNCEAIGEVNINSGCFIHCELMVFEGALKRRE